MPNTLLLTSPCFSVKFFIFKFIIVLLPTNWLHPLMIKNYYNFGDVACTSSSERCNQLKYGCSNASEAEGRRSGSRCRSFSNKSTARGFAPVKYSLKFFFEKVGRLLIYVRACSYTEPSKIVMHTITYIIRIYFTHHFFIRCSTNLQNGIEVVSILITK